MPGEGEFQGRIERIEGLIHRLEAIPDAAQRNEMRELLQAVLELHAAALESMLAIVSEVGDPESRLSEALLRDPLVASVLLLHGLHPQDLDARVRGAIEKAQGVLRGYGARVTFVGAPGRNVRLEVRGVDAGHTAKAVRAVLEAEIYETAPDAASISILGLERFETPGFVPLEQILAAPVDSNGHAFAVANGKGAV
jgi:hypothetical protein